MAPLLRLNGVAKKFAGNVPGGTTAVSAVDLAIEQGQFVSLLGPSGCGKTTLLRMMAGLAEPTGGTIEWQGPKPGTRPDIGFVFQDATLMPWATAIANVMLPLRLKGVARSEAEVRARAALDLVDSATAFPRELSGGMRMRVSIARALVTEPRILLMDEPFAALDEITRHRLNDDLLQLWESARFTAVFVTHSVFESAYLSQRIVVMAARPGRIVADLATGNAVPRPADFRTSPEYGALCRRVSSELEAAMAAKAAA
jgi:NitT/TauT family transport system ATP-binding protein